MGFAVVKFVVVSSAFVAVLFASGYFAMRLALLGRQVSVPDVTGMTVAEAEERLSREDLFVEASLERHDDRLEQGRILAQEPSAGSELKKNRKVKVVTSLGPRVFTIPDVRGQSFRAARQGLQNEGLRLGGVAYAHTLASEADVVVSQTPLPSGESLGEEGISLLVSRGPREAVYVMPDLTGLTVDQVRGVFEARGLKIGSVRRERGAFAQRGAITRQYPDAGFPVAAGDTISLGVRD